MFLIDININLVPSQTLSYSYIRLDYDPKTEKSFRIPIPPQKHFQWDTGYGQR